MAGLDSTNVYNLEDSLSLILYLANYGDTSVQQYEHISGDQQKQSNCEELSLEQIERYKYAVYEIENQTMNREEMAGETIDVTWDQLQNTDIAQESPESTSVNSG